MAASDTTDTTEDTGATASRPGPRQRLSNRAGSHRHLLAGSATMVVGAAAQAITGAVFWLVAARIDTADDVGRATALFTSTLFIAYLAGLGLQVCLARYAPDRTRESHTVFAWGVLATVVAATVVGLAYLFVVDTEATDALIDWHPIAGPAYFALTSVGSALTLIVDVRWMTVRRWSLVLGRVSVVGLLRFPLLAFPSAGEETVHLFVVASFPLLLTGVVGVATMPRFTGGRHRLFPLPESRRAAFRYSMVNYLSTLAYQAPQFVLPVIVLLSVDPEENAAFYVAWGITTITLYVPMAIGQALLAEGGKGGTELRSQVRVILLGTTALMALATVVAFAGRDLITVVYGDDYADAARVMPILVAACIPWAVTSVFLTEARVVHRNLDTVAITLSLTVAILVPAVLLVPDDGIDGATTAFVIGNVTAALVASASHLLRRSEPVPADEIGVDPVEEELLLHP